MNFFISHVHSRIREALRTRRGATHRAEDVPRHTHKSYPRMRRVSLPKPRALEARLDETLLNRRSARTGARDKHFTQEEIGALLGHALGTRGESWGRNYPSGGSLYPIETYLITDRLEGEGPSIFHYNPSEHVLEYLWPLPPHIEMNHLVPRPKTLAFSAVVVFTAVWERSSAKYGDLTYSHGLLEAGHMSENILLVANALRMDACPMAGFDDALVTEMLDLDEGEQPVHSVILCKPLTRGAVS